ncbi:DUF3089 domain-containing protein [Membranihabitans marinus]|uniref:DUF3089 domain-containing protein n=1 Tax=Membranihabitans marinus TaxID=1227546 RepID=UPI001F3BB3F2|nr:DUF3089 domain-containing protein [Membranihabitans marinus]
MNNQVVFFLLLSMFLSCSNDDVVEPEEMPELETIDIPESTVNYNSNDNWVFHPNKTTILPNFKLDIAVIDKDLEVEQIIPITNNSVTNTGIDVFFVHPTVLTQNAKPENIDIEDQIDFQIAGTVLAQGGLLAKYGRMFAPKYRQSTGKTYQSNVDKEEQANIIATSYSDVKAAFLHYLDHYNNGNKIILAGHSQGSYLLSLLLRDVFDNDENLRSQLVTAALGGMRFIFADNGQYKGGFYENIPLCTTTDQCGCINTWASFDEDRSLASVNYAMPQFNPYLINSGLVYRAYNENEDWLVQDFSYYGENPSELINYITPDASYNFSPGNNFIAFNGLYTARFKREDRERVALSIDHKPQIDDDRPNELLDEKNTFNYPVWGYHVKDYHIYLWALMEQIDAKIQGCSN